MIDILRYWQTGRKTRSSPSGWISGNAPCCVHNGHTKDTRSRGGIKPHEDGWSYSCFNCGFTTGFQLGKPLGFRARKLLDWLGVPEAEINLINLDSMRFRSINGWVEQNTRTDPANQPITFAPHQLPELANFVCPGTAEYEYLLSRHVPMDYPYMTLPVDPETGYHRANVLIPFTYQNNLVGWTQRFLDDRKPKYLSEVSPGYVFGVDLQQPQWTHALVMEGVFCAASVGGLAVLHSQMSPIQIQLIQSLGKEITVVPDQDRSGLDMIDQALDLGWPVSIPDWVDCKDVNDAVKKYGRVTTLLTIMQSRETSRIKIELRRKALVKRIQR
jgi:hypothetical protein